MACHKNLSQEELQAIRTLDDDRSIVIIKVDEISCIGAWDRADY